MFKWENFLRETALVQLGLTKISKSPLNIINYTILTAGLCFGLSAVNLSFLGSKGVLALYGLSTCNIIYIILYSFAYFARVISEEKQNKTMTLLRLTPISQESLFFGKLLPPFINLLMMMVFQLPIIALAITLGGVSLMQVFKVYVLLVIIASCFAVLGAWISAGNPENWLSHFNFIFVFFGLAVLYGLLQILLMNKYTAPIIDFINLNNPISKCYWVIYKPGESIWASIFIGIVTLLMGLKLAIKSFITHIDFDEIVPAEIKRKTKEFKRRVDFGKYPLLQKEMFFGCGGRKSQILIFTVLTFLGVFFYFISEPDRPSYSSQPSKLSQVLFMGISCLVLFVIYSGGSAFKREIEEKTWSDLLLTPLSPYQIINQKIAGSIKFVLPMFIFIILIFLIKYQETILDLKIILKNYRFAYIIPSFSLLVMNVFILVQLFEKIPTALTVYILLGSSILLLISGNEFNKSNNFWFIFLTNIVCLVLAGSLYFISAKIIEKRSQP
ncbi:MAG: ABC transporter permease subunit [Lentisphaeraceae bacterium]|nr:ABC transporter permease subunit [Lentisphaeraceae bacterium]